MAASPNPLELSTSGMTFQQLDALRAYLERIQTYAEPSLAHYHDAVSGGFYHQVDPEKPQKPGNFSKASTATCLAYLAATGLIEQEPWSENLEKLRREIVLQTRWSSAGLPVNNPFTTSFLLEAVHVLSGSMEELSSKERPVVLEKLGLLESVLARDGSLQIDNYAPTAFLTQSAVRVLRKWDRLTDENLNRRRKHDRNTD